MQIYIYLFLNNSPSTNNIRIKFSLGNLQEHPCSRVNANQLGPVRFVEEASLWANKKIIAYVQRGNQ
jgi:hypothetical protein